MNKKRIIYSLIIFAVVCIALVSTLPADTTTNPATVSLIQSRIVAQEDNPIVAGNHSLKYIEIQENAVFGVIEKQDPEPLKSFTTNTGILVNNTMPSGVTTNE